MLRVFLSFFQWMMAHIEKLAQEKPDEKVCMVDTFRKESTDCSL
jgi:hypothetical protein